MLFLFSAEIAQGSTFALDCSYHQSLESAQKQMRELCVRNNPPVQVLYCNVENIELMEQCFLGVFLPLIHTLQLRIPAQCRIPPAVRRLLGMVERLSKICPTLDTIHVSTNACATIVFAQLNYVINNNKINLTVQQSF